MLFKISKIIHKPTYRILFFLYFFHRVHRVFRSADHVRVKRSSRAMTLHYIVIHLYILYVYSLTGRCGGGGHYELRRYKNVIKVWTRGRATRGRTHTRCRQRTRWIREEKKEKFVTVEITPIIIGVGYKGECV